MREDRGMGKGKGRCGSVKRRGRCGRVYGVSVGKCVGVWGRGLGGVGKVRRGGGVKKCGGRCGRVYGGECGNGLLGCGGGEVRGMGGVDEGKGRWGV